MLNVQHIQPIGSDEKLTYYYTSLSAQPLRVRFDFLPKYTHRSSVGNVTVSLEVSGREYGPYVTSIRSTTNVFNGRWRLHPSKQAQEIGDLIRGLNALLEKSWNALLPLKQPITGEMILQQAGLLEKEVSRV